MKTKLLSIFVLLGLTTVQAQYNSLTLDDAIKTALQNNREIKVAKLEVEKANAAVSEAFGYALPSVDISASFSHFLEKPKMSFPDFAAMLNNSTYGVLVYENIIPFDENKLLPMDFKLQTFAKANNYEAKATVSQILFNSAVFRGIGASQIYLNLAKENLKNTVSETVIHVKKAFYGLLLTEELYNIASARFENAQAHLKNIKAMREQGLVSEFTELQVEVQVENIRPVLLQLENANRDAGNGLKILLNIPQESKLDIHGKLVYEPEELPSAEDLIAEAKERNPAIQALKIKNQLDEEFAAIDKGNYWPTIAAFGNYSFAGTGEGWDLSNYRSSIVGVSFTMNLFQGGRTENKVEQSMITYKQTQEQIRLLTDATAMQITSKLNDLKRVKKQLEAMKRNVSLAEKAYAIAKDRFKVGEGNELEVKDADVELSSAKTNYIQAVHDYRVARAVLYNLAGRIDNEYISFVREKL